MGQGHARRRGGPCGNLRRLGAAVLSFKILIERRRSARGTPARDKSRHLHHPNAAIERHRNHVAGSHHAPRRIDAGAVDANVTGARQCRRGGARAYQPGVPQPLVDALPIASGRRAVIALD